MTPRPLINRRIIEALLDAELRRDKERKEKEDQEKRETERSLLLVNARYDDTAPTDFTSCIDGRQRVVQVRGEDSVLGIVDAWQRHLAKKREKDDGRVLVVTSGVTVTELGWDIRAHAVGRRTLGVDRAEIVKQLFVATDLDARMYRETWLLDALLDAEPVDGWPRSGTVLTRDAALRALVGQRLGIAPSAGNGPLDLDADALLTWSRKPAGPARFAQLSEAERGGLTNWLTETVGPAASTLLALAADGRGGDAMALGVLGSVLGAPDAPAGAAFALGGLFGASLRSSEALPPFTDAVTGTLARWVAQATGSGLQAAEARERVYAVLNRADELAAEAGLTRTLRADPLLPSGMTTRLRDLAADLHESVGAAEDALGRVLEHQLASLHPESCEAARMAVRLVRWLAEPPSTVESVGQAVGEQVSQWGWVDRALTVLAAGDPMSDPVVGQAYHRLIVAAQERRAALDEQFGHRLAAWTRTADATVPGGALPIENVLSQLVEPLVAQRAPLVLVLDGMSASVAAQLSDEIDRRVWTEIVPRPEEGTQPRRQAAVSMLPSVTTVSRASLLSGSHAVGGQEVESAGFGAYWRKKPRRSGTLFHKGRVGGVEGHRLAPELLEALAGEGVVGVVLNTVDDALEHGREGGRTTWRLRDISHLLDLLNAARDHGRPVVLVSDHGHVLERGESDDGPTRTAGAQGARWRIGRPDEGEVQLSGPRVLEGEGTIVAPWRADIHYTPRKAGYHGGASLAEVTVPVIVLVPSPKLKPSQWVLLPNEQVLPAWWQPRSGAAAPVEAEAHPAVVSGATAGMRKPVGERVRDEAGRFAAHEVAPEGKSLGQRVVLTRQFQDQRSFVRRPPDNKAVAAVIDALVSAGGKLTPDAVTAAATAATGRSQRNPEVFVTVVQRLLNVEGYGVISLVEGGRTVELNLQLLTDQFETEEP